MAVDVPREIKTTQELYTLKYADVLSLIKENGSLVITDKSDMEKNGTRAGYPPAGKGTTPRPQQGQPDRTSSEPNLLPPLNKNRLMKETSWFRYAQNMSPPRNTATRSSQMSKVKDTEVKKPALSPLNKESKSPMLSHSPYKLDDPRARHAVDARDVLVARTKKKRKKDPQNKENTTKPGMPGRDKFVDYLNQKRELTKQIHLKSNHVEYHERPEQQFKPRLSYPMVRGRYKQEDVSIRTKLEEFKRWHENEYKLKYTKARIDGKPRLERPNSAGRQRRPVEGPAPMLIKRVGPRVDAPVPVPEVRESSGSSEQLDSKRLKLKSEETQSKPSIVPDEVKRSIQKHTEVKSRQTKSTKITVSPENEALLSARLPVSSAKTWRTWRGVNSSCAYQDVKKYIDENELMPENKERMIKDWISDVDRFMSDIQEENEGQEAEIPPSYVDPEPIEPSETLSSSGT